MRKQDNTKGRSKGSLGSLCRGVSEKVCDKDHLAQAPALPSIAGSCSRSLWLWRHLKALYPLWWVHFPECSSLCYISKNMHRTLILLQLIPRFFFNLYNLGDDTCSFFHPIQCTIEQLLKIHCFLYWMNEWIFFFSINIMHKIKFHSQVQSLIMNQDQIVSS